MDDLNYTGEISEEVQDGVWFTTTKGRVLQYTMPDNETPVTLQEAISKCQNLKARIWDVNPLQGLAFHHIKQDVFY